jgi:hypothetical protein
MFDYFSASSDEAAASAIGLLGGPGAPEAAPFDSIPVKGIDPLVQLVTLEGLLTGRDYDQIVAGPRAGAVLASQDGGQRQVVTLTDELQAALADADDAQLASVAVPWSQTGEFWGQGDLWILARLLHELAELARRSRTRDEYMYCWICV